MFRNRVNAGSCCELARNWFTSHLARPEQSVA